MDGEFTIGFANRWSQNGRWRARTMSRYLRPLARMSTTLMPHQWCADCKLSAWHFHKNRRFRNNHKYFGDNNIGFYAAANESFASFSFVFTLQFTQSKMYVNEVPTESILHIRSEILSATRDTSPLRYPQCDENCDGILRTMRTVEGVPRYHGRTSMAKQNELTFTWIDFPAGIVSVIVVLEVEETQSYRNYWRKMGKICRWNSHHPQAC